MSIQASVKPLYSRTNLLFLAVTIAIGSLSALLAFALKHITEYFESEMASRVGVHPFLILVFPLIGLSLIYFLRQKLFHKKQNKGIKEVFESIGTGGKLPAYKIPSHFINGFLTVIFGGSTGIEVSTVVATAAIGSSMASLRTVLSKYKQELICAGISAGVTVLFGSPLAGALFCVEVIARRKRASFFAALLFAIMPATLLLYLSNEESLLTLSSSSWHYHALPYFIGLSLFTAVNSVYLTKSVLFFKMKAAKVESPLVKILVGSLLISILILFFPMLYGDSYAAIKSIAITSASDLYTGKILFLIAAMLVLKPIITSLTLATGGDGGVFAPSLVTGSFTGLIFAAVANHYGAHIIPLNFMLVGMAGVLSASIAAPLTAAFLVCGICGSYFLLLPLLLVSFVSRFTARKIYADTVYSYKEMKPVS